MALHRQGFLWRYPTTRDADVPATSESCHDVETALHAVTPAEHGRASSNAACLNFRKLS